MIGRRTASRACVLAGFVAAVALPVVVFIRYHRAQGIFALLFAVLHPLFILIGFGAAKFFSYSGYVRSGASAGWIIPQLSPSRSCFSRYPRPYAPGQDGTFRGGATCIGSTIWSLRWYGCTRGSSAPTAAP